VGRLDGILKGEGLLARATRGAAVTALGFGFSQGVRLVSNLVLTRLLFPEAFGLMTLVNVFIIGLSLLSDVGVGPSIMQSKRGDEPDFLNTAWTLQVVRGAVLWLGTCILAVPASIFYDAPALMGLLPTAGLSLLITGFNPTRVDTANRHLLLGRVTLLDLIAQTLGIAAMIALAFATRSVWALVGGGLVGSLTKLALNHALLPGIKNRFRWERTAVLELVHFGKWIFLSTMLHFLIAQGDKAILGKWLPLDVLGVYNVGYFFASFPIMLATAVVGRVLIPIYRDHHPATSPENFQKLRRMRFALTGGLMGLVLFMAHAGVPLIGLLYDDRYLQGGPILVAIALTQVVQLLGMTYDQAALAVGDSKRFFYLIASRALVQTACFAAGLVWGGLQGALLGQGIAMLIVHPMIIVLAVKLRVWDPLHDATFALVGLSIGGVAFWRYFDELMALAHLG
jgi:O-antigen/teichoic acid export membrane protein